MGKGSFGSWAIIENEDLSENSCSSVEQDDQE